MLFVRFSELSSDCLLLIVYCGLWIEYCLLLLSHIVYRIFTAIFFIFCLFCELLSVPCCSEFYQICLCFALNMFFITGY